jgi:hypothetical protein
MSRDGGGTARTGAGEGDLTPQKRRSLEWKKKKEGGRAGLHMSGPTTRLLDLLWCYCECFRVEHECAPPWRWLSFNGCGLVAVVLPTVAVD